MVPSVGVGQKTQTHANSRSMLTNWEQTLIYLKYIYFVFQDQEQIYLTEINRIEKYTKKILKYKCVKCFKKLLTKRVSRHFNIHTSRPVHYILLPLTLTHAMLMTISLNNIYSLSSVTHTYNSANSSTSIRLKHTHCLFVTPDNTDWNDLK